MSAGNHGPSPRRSQSDEARKILEEAEQRRRERQEAAERVKQESKK